MPAALDLEVHRQQSTLAMISSESFAPLVARALQPSFDGLVATD